MFLTIIYLFFVSDQHLLLIEGLDDMTFGSYYYVVVFSEVFLNHAYRRHFVYDFSYIYWFALYIFDDIMVVALKIFVVLLWNAIFYEICVKLDNQFSIILASETLTVKNIRQL